MTPDAGVLRKEEVLIHTLRLNRAHFLRQTQHRHGRAPSPISQHGRLEEEDAEQCISRSVPSGGKKEIKPWIKCLQENPADVVEFLKITVLLSHLNP